MILSKKSYVESSGKVSFESKCTFRTSKNQKQTYVESTKEAHGDSDPFRTLKPKDKH